jgi:DNA-binding protein H-NS
MTKSYLQIVKQIETLKVEAEKLRKQEVDGVIKRIREAIEHYGLTAADLGLGIRAAAKGKSPVAAKKRRGKGKAAKTAAVVKFRDEAGNTWGGRGKRPQWLRDALNGGKQLSDFLVK